MAIVRCPDRRGDALRPATRAGPTMCVGPWRLDVDARSLVPAHQPKTADDGATHRAESDSAYEPGRYHAPTTPIFETSTCRPASRQLE